MRIFALAALLSGGVTTATAQLPAGFPCRLDDRDCARHAALKHRVKTADYWREALAKPLRDRIGPASQDMVEFLLLDVIHQRIPASPRASQLTPDFLADVKAALDELPSAIRTRFECKLTGIYFIDDIGGTGFTDLVDWTGPDSAGFIVLDPRRLMERRANEWATWKESTPFRDDPRWRIEAVIAAPRDNTRKNAIQYILLHELAHVLAIGNDFHPSWNVAPASVSAATVYPFFRLSWSIDYGAGRYVTHFDSQFPERSNVVYYFGAKLDGPAMPVVYERLEKTNFVSLYATTNPGDDFAESFASYVHTVLLKRPWAVHIYHDDKRVKTVRACWDEPRCAGKRRVIESILGLQLAPPGK